MPVLNWFFPAHRFLRDGTAPGLKSAVWVFILACVICYAVNGFATLSDDVAESGNAFATSEERLEYAGERFAERPGKYLLGALHADLGAFELMKKRPGIILCLYWPIWMFLMPTYGTPKRLVMPIALRIASLYMVVYAVCLAVASYAQVAVGDSHTALRTTALSVFVAAYCLCLTTSYVKLVDVAVATRAERMSERS